VARLPSSVEFHRISIDGKMSGSTTTNTRPHVPEASELLLDHGLVMAMS